MFSECFTLLKQENQKLENYFQLGVNEERKLLEVSSQKIQDIEKSVDKVFYSLNEFYFRRGDLLKDILRVYESLTQMAERLSFPFEGNEREKYEKIFSIQNEKRKQFMQMILDQDEKIFLILKKIKSYLSKDIQKKKLQKKQMNSYKCEGLYKGKRVSII